MDFERAAIKALFYDYPIEEAIRALDVSKERLRDVYTDILPQLVRWREQAFTMTEADFVQELTESKWMTPIQSPFGNVDKIYRPFFVLQSVANMLLEEDEQSQSHNPIVKFDYLFRWKDLTTFISEDLLTTAFKAGQDVQNNKEHSQWFLWQDYVPHNNKDLDNLLKKGLTDIHAHETATVDVFHLNWVDLMNDIWHKKGCEKIKYYQELSLVTPRMDQLYPLKRLCVAAAYLRVYFYKQYVIKQGAGQLSLERVKLILEDEATCMIEADNIQQEIAVLRLDGQKTPQGQTIDYAIENLGVDIDHRGDNILMVYQGERKLLYTIFYDLYRGGVEVLKDIPYFYLYILIKTRIRKEFVQINPLKGFKNFQDYQDRKEIFVKAKDPIGKNWHKYVAQSTLVEKNDEVELRVSPNKKSNFQLKGDLFARSVFSDKWVLPSTKKRLGLVIHFIKLSNRERRHLESVSRYYNYRQRMKRQMNYILEAYDKQHPKGAMFTNGHEEEIPIVGIDTASTEMFCRPEVFGHIYRFADKKGIYGKTYHVGEDFFDIVDGLRAIDEAIFFLELDQHCRLGHALALGIDSKKYYEKRRRQIIMPRQYLLDDCVWLKMRARENSVVIPEALANFLDVVANRLFNELGYRGPFNMVSYWNSMLLRGNDPDEMKESLSDWALTACQHNPLVENASHDAYAKAWFNQYHYEIDVKEKGDEIITEKWPIEIIEVVRDLQEKMRKFVESKDITIECNPTSNLKIGHFEKYEEHPLLTVFDPLSKTYDVSYPALRATISTDDRGVFATSLYNEYSLIALALLKQKDESSPLNNKYNHRAVYDYIDRIRLNGQQQRFK